MDISVELTLSPLTNNYEEHVVTFIKALRKSKFKVVENPLSTQIFGAYDELMLFLTKEIETAFKSFDMGLMHIKLVKTDRSAYEPNF